MPGSAGSRWGVAIDAACRGAPWRCSTCRWLVAAGLMSWKTISRSVCSSGGGRANGLRALEVAAAAEACVAGPSMAGGSPHLQDHLLVIPLCSDNLAKRAASLPGTIARSCRAACHRRRLGAAAQPSRCTACPWRAVTIFQAEIQAVPCGRGLPRSPLRAGRPAPAHLAPLRGAQQGPVKQQHVQDPSMPRTAGQRASRPAGCAGRAPRRRCRPPSRQVTAALQQRRQAWGGRGMAGVSGPFKM